MDGEKNKEELDRFQKLDGVGACLEKHNSFPRGPGVPIMVLDSMVEDSSGGAASWTQPNIDKNGGELQLSVALTSKLAGGFYINYFSVGENGFGLMVRYKNHRISYMWMRF